MKNFIAIAFIAASIFTVSTVSAQGYRSNGQQQAYDNAGSGNGQVQTAQEYAQRYDRSARGDNYGSGRYHRDNNRGGCNRAYGNNWNSRDRGQYAHHNGRREYSRVAQQCGSTSGRMSERSGGGYRY